MNYRITALVLAVFAVGSTQAAFAAKAKSKTSVKRPPVKSSTNTPKGVGQLPGGQGEFGVPYIIGGSEPLNFILKSAEYAINRVTIGEAIYAPGPDEKLLVLHFSIQNAQKEEAYVDWDTLRFTAIDEKNVNREYPRSVGLEETRDPLQITLKPVQKIDCYTVISVPAKGCVPKLMVLPPNDSPVLRYDLKDKVKKLSEPFVDPSDPTGLSALTNISGQIGNNYPLSHYDFNFIKLNYSAVKASSDEEDEDASNKQNLFITLQIKNALSPHNLHALQHAAELPHPDCCHPDSHLVTIKALPFLYRHCKQPKTEEYALFDPWSQPESDSSQGFSLFSLYHELKPPDEFLLHPVRQYHLEVP